MRRLLPLFCVALPLAACMKPVPEPSFTAKDHIVKRQGIKNDAAVRTLLLIAAILAAASLASCTILRPTGSWVEVANEGDAGPLSEAIVVFVAQSAPEPGAAIELASPPAEQAANLVTLQVREKLAGRGYKIADEEASRRHRLRYLISKYGEGILLRITLDDTEASVLFARDAGGTLRAGAPLTMRQKGKVL